MDHGANDNHSEDSTKRKRFTMIQRNSDPIRRDDSIDNMSSPKQLTQNTPKENNSPPFKKSRGRPQKQYWTHEWSDRATEALIELWSKKEELYNKQHPLFYVKDSKDRAVEEIRDNLSEQGYDVTSENILSKFQSLRTYFCTQRTKASSARRSGVNYSGDDGECKWRFYKSLVFLDDNMKPRDSHRKMDLINAEYGVPPSFTTPNDRMTLRHCDNFYSPSTEFIKHDPENNGCQSSNGHNKHHIDSSFEDAPKNTQDGGNGYANENSIPTVDKHEDFIFGELVGNMIHQLPSGKHKDMIKLEIQQLIIKAKYASAKENEST